MTSVYLGLDSISSGKKKKKKRKRARARAETLNMFCFLLCPRPSQASGRGFKVVQIVCVTPMGAQARGGPQGPKLCKFQTSSPDPERE